MNFGRVGAPPHLSSVGCFLAGNPFRSRGLNLNLNLKRPVEHCRAQFGSTHRSCFTSKVSDPRKFQVIQCGALTKSAKGDEEPEETKFSPKASGQLSRATRALQRYGWLGFWSQLSLSLTSAVVLLFSVAFSAQAGPKISLYLTMFASLASFMNTFKFFIFVRLSRRMRAYLEAPPDAKVKKVTKEQVLNSLSQSAVIAVLGLGSAVVGLQASVGVLLAKTLTNTTANPFLSGGSGAWNPVLAFDIFLLQASTNTILSHFIGLVFSLWVLVRLREKTLWQVVFGLPSN